MNIYDSLAFDHREVERMLDHLEKAMKNHDTFAAVLFVQLRRVVVAHAHAEEAVFYNALRSLDAFKGLMMRGYAEHAKAEALLRTLSPAELSESLVKDVADDLRQHIREEETEVFAAARKVLTDEEADQLGNAFQRAMVEFGKDAPSVMKTTLDLVTNLLPPRFTASYREGFDDHPHAAAR